jgi:Met-zincin
MHARTVVAAAASVVVVAGFGAAPTFASHSWNGYHWARTANPFTLKLGKNTTTSQWSSLLGAVSADWSRSNVLDTTVAAGGTRPKPCKATRGRVEVCNASYGNNGWLGLAQIWVSGRHIVQGVAKVNDFYFSLPAYNNVYAKRHVLCQEVGHTLGLDHQYAASCMNDEDGLFDPTYVDPNQHDYDQLATIYSHLDSTSTVGRAQARKGMRVYMFVFWAKPGRAR